MWFTSFMQSVPTGARLTILLFVIFGLMFLANWFFRRHTTRIFGGSEDERDSRAAVTLALEITLTAYLFIGAFVVAQFLGQSVDARTLNAEEKTAIGQMISGARLLNADTKAIEVPVKAYVADLRANVWPALQAGDTETVSDAQAAAADDLVSAISATFATNSEAYTTSISGALKDAVVAGSGRTTALPTLAAPALIGLVGLLGLVSLFLTALIAPRWRTSARILMITIGFTVGMLFFFIVEISNPFLRDAQLPWFAS